MSIPHVDAPLHRLLAVLAVSVYAIAWSAMMTAPAMADPSASAQQFFGFGNGGGGSSSALPASCDISKLLAQNDQLNTQITQLNDQEQTQLKSLQDQQKNLQPGDEAGNEALQSQQQQILDNTQSQLAAIKAQQDQIHAATQGPSDQCKKDLVAQTVANTQSQFKK
jgi:hypothetical protein